MSKHDTLHAVFYSDPDNPGWDFWGWSDDRTLDRDLQYLKRRGWQFRVVKDIRMPELKQNPSEPETRSRGREHKKTRRHHAT